MWFEIEIETVGITRRILVRVKSHKRATGIFIEGVMVWEMGEMGSEQ